MKKNLISAFLVSILIAATLHFTQRGDMIVVHNHYKSYYNYDTKETDSVIWDLTPSMVACPDQVRKDAFAQDPMLTGSAKPSDYAVNKGNPDRASWIDEGHYFSYQDAMCNRIDKVECFYMSNMSPQYHAFNAGDWKTLEVQCRVWAKTQTLHILAGPIAGPKHLPAGEDIPSFMWKAVYMNGSWTCWIMPNDKTSVGHDYSKWEKTTAELDQRTGLKL